MIFKMPEYLKFLNSYFLSTYLKNAQKKSGIYLFFTAYDGKIGSDLRKISSNFFLAGESLNFVLNYIGSTDDFSRRMSEHMSDCEENKEIKNNKNKIFVRCYSVPSADEYKDVESFLIKHFKLNKMEYPNNKYSWNNKG